MRAILLGAVAALGLCPAIASAVVTVKFKDITVVPTGADQVVDLDVWADPGPGDSVNEGLDAFTIAIDSVDFRNGVRFVLPAAGQTFQEPPQYVFTGRNAPPEDFGSTADRIQVGAAITGAGVNISDVLNGLVRLRVLIPGSVTQGAYNARLDPGAFSLGGTDPSLAAAVPEQGTGTITVIPEPASLGLIVFGGLLALRRRRVA